MRAPGPTRQPERMFYCCGLSGAVGREPSGQSLNTSVIRRGIAKVVKDFRRAARLDDREFERVFAAGGGPPSVVGRDRDGQLIVPAVTLWALVPGIRSQASDGRARLIQYLVDNFEDLVYV